MFTHIRLFTYIRQWVSSSLAALGSVFAIVALVAVLLFPPLLAQQAQSSADTQGAQQQPCLSNIKALGFAIQEYASDWDERFPAGSQSLSPAAPSGVGWAGQIYSLPRNVQIFHCPTDAAYPAVPQYAVSYGLNANMANQVPASFTDLGYTVMLFETGGDPVHLHSVSEDAQNGAAIFSASGDGTDGNLRAGRGGSVVGGVRYACGYLGHRVPDNPPGQFYQAMGRHHNLPSFAFADGHVASLYPGRVSSGSNAADHTAPQTGGATGTAAGVDDPEYDATFSIK